MKRFVSKWGLIFAGIFLVTALILRHVHFGFGWEIILFVSGWTYIIGSLISGTGFYFTLVVLYLVGWLIDFYQNRSLAVKFFKLLILAFLLFPYLWIIPALINPQSSGV